MDLFIRLRQNTLQLGAGRFIEGGRKGFSLDQIFHLEV
jgi:hypothetical protein